MFKIKSALLLQISNSTQGFHASHFAYVSNKMYENLWQHCDKIMGVQQ